MVCFHAESDLFGGRCWLFVVAVLVQDPQTSVGRCDQGDDDRGRSPFVEPARAGWMGRFSRICHAARIGCLSTKLWED